jgi:hypothetical protein
MNSTAGKLVIKFVLVTETRTLLSEGVALKGLVLAVTLDVISENRITYYTLEKENNSIMWF